MSIKMTPWVQSLLVCFRKYFEISQTRAKSSLWYLQYGMIKDTLTRLRLRLSHVLQPCTELFNVGVMISKQKFAPSLKLDSHVLKKCFLCFSEIPLKMMKNAFYFILKAPFTFKIFKFLCWLFGHVERTGLIRKTRLISRFMM